MDGAEAMRHVKDLFYEALRMPASQRDPFLQRACAADPSIRLRVQALLRAHDDAGTFLSDPAAGLDARRRENPQ